MVVLGVLHCAVNFCSHVPPPPPKKKAFLYNLRIPFSQLMHRLQFRSSHHDDGGSTLLRKLVTDQTAVTAKKKSSLSIYNGFDIWFYEAYAVDKTL